VEDYLPNGLEAKIQRGKDTKRKNQKSSNIQYRMSDILLDFLEKIAYKFQLFYMRPKRTIEKVSQGRVLFHPRDCSGRVIREYNDRVKEQESGRV